MGRRFCRYSNNDYSIIDELIEKAGLKQAGLLPHFPAVKGKEPGPGVSPVW